MNAKREPDAAERIAREADDLEGVESSLVRELRELGSDRNLLEAVLARVEDERTLSDRKLRRSLDEMHGGELIDITPGA